MYISRKELNEQFVNIQFPCHLIFYGPGCDQRTRFSREYQEWFYEGYFENKEDAIEVLLNSRYDGPAGELYMFRCENLEQI